MPKVFVAARVLFVVLIAAVVGYALPVLAQGPPIPDDNPPPQDDNPKIVFEFPFEALPPDQDPYFFLINTFTPPNMWPLPWPRFKFPRRSGYIPGPCRELFDDPEGAVLDCWLERHPTIGNSIVWEGAPLRYTRWRFWTDAQKADLRKAFVDARAWKAAGFAGPWPGDFFVDPPANQEIPHHADDDDIQTVLSAGDAWKRYLSGIAISLASEIDAWVPWSLRDYTGDMLIPIFDGAHQYTLDRNDGGPLDSVFPGYLARRSTPAHAATVYRFLLDEGLIGTSRVGTIERLLNWSRDHMQHSFTIFLADGMTEVPLQTRVETFWGYTGIAPVSEIIAGRVASHPDLGIVHPTHFHWTTGCGGTTRFLRAVLSLVNIPVREQVSLRTCGHSMAHFPADGLYLSHSDDPYSRMFNTSIFSGDRLLVPTRTFNRWFPVADEATSCMNVGRRVIDLNLETPSDYLVAQHCQDLIDGLAHPDSRVFETMGRVYTVAELEARALWFRLDLAAMSSPAPECVAWRSFE